MSSAETLSTVPLRLAMHNVPESSAARCSMPVPTSGASGRMSGTACRWWFAPMSARFASSCSKNGTRAAETPTICEGDTPM